MDVVQQMESLGSPSGATKTVSDPRDSSWNPYLCPLKAENLSLDASSSLVTSRPAAALVLLVSSMEQGPPKRICGERTQPDTACHDVIASW